MDGYDYEGPRNENSRYERHSKRVIELKVTVTLKDFGAKAPERVNYKITRRRLWTVCLKLRLIKNFRYCNLKICLSS